MSAPDSPAARARARRWLAMNYVRRGLTLVGWLAALEALTLLHR